MQRKRYSPLSHPGVNNFGFLHSAKLRHKLGAPWLCNAFATLHLDSSPGETDKRAGYLGSLKPVNSARNQALEQSNQLNGGRMPPAAPTRSERVPIGPGERGTLDKSRKEPLFIQYWKKVPGYISPNKSKIHIPICSTRRWKPHHEPPATRATSHENGHTGSEDGPTGLAGHRP